MKTKIFAIVLALLMLLPMATSCFNKPSEGEESESNSEVVSDVKDTETETESETETETETESEIETETETETDTEVETEEDLYDDKGYLKDSLPELNFDGYEFCILGWDGYSADFWVEESGSTVISSSLYNRNNVVESRLGVNIEAVFIPGGYSDQADFVTYVQNAAYAGGNNEYDLIGSYSMVGGTLAMNGIISNLYELDHLDFEKPWWSASLIEGSQIGNNLYFATGDLANSYIYALHFLAVNLNMLDTLTLEDPRQMVKDDTWTLEKMIEMTKGVGAELDGEEGKTVGDVYGYSYYSGVEGDCWIAASGMRMSEKNENGIMQLSDDFLGNNTHTLITRVADQRHTTLDWYNKADKTVFNKGNALFGGVAGEAMATLNNVPFKYGVLPYPKITDDQEGYYSLLGFAYVNFSIPTNVTDSDMSAAVLECMNSEAYRSSAPVLYETVFKSRFSNDPIDSDMYDIIRAGAYTDTTRIFHAIFESSYGWKGTPTGAFRTAVNSNSVTWMSDVAKIKDNINMMLSNISAST